MHAEYWRSGSRKYVSISLSQKSNISETNISKTEVHPASENVWNFNFKTMDNAQNFISTVNVYHRQEPLKSGRRDKSR
jgi:hypothetical protein